MICFPNAKINIGLNIIGKRVDGYHDIESIFYPINLCDVLEVIENTDSSDAVIFHSTGIDIPGEPDANLCVKAYNLIAKDYSLPKIKIHLHKIIPIGAGLGGGSADAAFFIKLLNEKFDIGLSWGEQHNYARLLGSDCSFFITNKPAFAEGKGDKLELTNLNLKSYFLVVVHPRVHISTAEAYSMVVPAKPLHSLEKNSISLPVNKWKGVIKNDFEKSVNGKYPVVGEIIQTLYNKGAIYASMTGSGSAVYGLFEKEMDTPNEFDNYFVWKEKI